MQYHRKFLAQKFGDIGTFDDIWHFRRYDKKNCSTNEKLNQIKVHNLRYKSQKYSVISANSAILGTFGDMGTGIILGKNRGIA